MRKELEMYLSCLLLDPRDRRVRKVLSNRYELHRTLLFPYPELTREEIGLLYRVEPTLTHELQPVKILAQTQVAPEWHSLEPARLPVLSVETKEFHLTPKPGERFYFRLEGNPTVRRNNGDYKGKRVELRTIEEQEQWLVNKAARHGFRVINLETTDLGKVVSQKAEDDLRHTITHQAVLYQGLLEVTDIEKFVDAVAEGIGAAKGFGFGLLSLAGLRMEK